MSYIDNWREVNKFFHCECYTEGVLVSHYEDDTNEKEPVVMVELCMWKRGEYHPPKSLRERLRWAWQILWHGDIWKDQVTMTCNEAKSLGEYLVEVAK